MSTGEKEVDRTIALRDARPLRGRVGREFRPAEDQHPSIDVTTMDDEGLLIAYRELQAQVRGTQEYEIEDRFVYRPSADAALPEDQRPKRVMRFGPGQVCEGYFPSNRFYRLRREISRRNLWNSV